MKKPLLLICLLCSLVANAQIFAPPGAEWSFKYAWGGTGQYNLMHYVYVGDTIIDGISCNKIVGQTFDDEHFFYSDNDRIYYYNPVYNIFDKIFDYTLNFGDSIQLHRSCLYQPPPWVEYDSIYYARIVDKGVEQINGENYRWIYYYTPNKPGALWHSFQGKYYEKLGFLDGYFTYQDEYAISIDAPQVYCLKTYIDTLLTQPVVSSNCFIPTSIEEQNSSSFTIYPNPSSGVFQIQSKQPVKFFEVVDMLGKTVLSTPISGSEVNLSELPQGIYAAKVVFVNGRQGYTKVVIQ